MSSPHEIFHPTNLSAPGGTALKSEAPMRKQRTYITAPTMIIEFVSIAFHAFRSILQCP